MSCIEIVRQMDNHLRVIEEVKETLAGPIIEIVAKLVGVLSSGGKLLVMGNGGSAADAQHLAAELVGRFLMERRALPVIALTTDTSILTAVGNDYGFDQVFSRQVEALATPGDMVFGISTSGNSRNVINGLTVAREKGCSTVGLLGRDGGAIAGMVDISLTISSPDTPRIQEAHQLIIHIICDLVEKQLFGSREEQR
ncbi:MAG: D-sedoheptulose 7-phosphate isomerase [Desulfuromonadales bacterium]|nr:D-sedoheptulose 7-phosphate isomerase [Desulfuromonadales bacterium]